MTATTWVTVVAYDTPFLAQLASDHLEDEGVRTRVLGDSAGGNLPEVAFMTGGYRVQVATDDADLARRCLRELPDDGLAGVDVGAPTDPDGMPDQEDQALPRRSLAWPARLIALTLILMFAWSIAISSGIPLPWWY